MNDTPNLSGLRDAYIEKAAAMKGLRSLLVNAAKHFKKGGKGLDSLTSNIPPSVIPPNALKNAKKVSFSMPSRNPRPLSNALSYDAQGMLRANAKANPHWTRERLIESMQNMGYAPNEYNIDELFPKIPLTH